MRRSDSFFLPEPARGVEHAAGQIARDDVAALVRHLVGRVTRARGYIKMHPAARVQHLGCARERVAPRVGRTGDVVVRILVVYLLYGLSLFPGRVHSAPHRKLEIGLRGEYFPKIGFGASGLEGSQNRAGGRAVASREQGGQGDEFMIALWRIAKIQAFEQDDA